MTRTRLLSPSARALVAPAALVLVLATAVVIPSSQAPASAAVPPGFSEVTAFSGLVDRTTRSVSAGTRTVRVDYVERTGSATALLTW